MRTVSFDHPNLPELESHAARTESAHQGLESVEPQTVGSGFAADINDAPLGLRLDGLFRDRGLPLPPDYRIYEGKYALWLVPHRASVTRRRGLTEVTSLGMRVKYLTDGVCSVVSLMPEAQFVDLGHLNFSVSSDAYGSLSAKSGVTGGQPAAPGAQLEIATDAELEAKLAFSFNVATPIISAVGKGSRRAEWGFELDKKPLFGRDIETWSILLLPAAQTVLEYEIVLSLTKRLAFIPSRWESPSVRLQVPLV